MEKLTNQDCEKLEKKVLYKDNICLSEETCKEPRKKEVIVNTLIKELFNSPDHGEHIIHYQDGTIFGIEQYKSGKKHGTMQYFNQDGSKDFEIDFSNGTREGYYHKFDKEGNIMEAKLYRNGSEVPYVKKSVAEQKDNYLLELFYSSEEKNKYINVQIVNGEYEGKYTCWWPNGQIKATCTYQNGLIEGESKEYRQNGSLHKVSNWENGKKNGIELIYK
jgi:antitoxin component YwqK of YwqJK toxin-antitoxin module